MGMSAIVEAKASDERSTNACSVDAGEDGELAEAGRAEGAELVRTEECEEAACGLGWKFGNRSLTSSINDETCLIG